MAGIYLGKPHCLSVTNILLSNGPIVATTALCLNDISYLGRLQRRIFPMKSSKKVGFWDLCIIPKQYVVEILIEIWGGIWPGFWYGRLP